MNLFRSQRTTSARRRALTLIELVVVIAILVALSGLVIPLVQGLGFQTNAATNATVANDVNRSIGTYATRFDTQPDMWDSMMNTSGVIFSKVHASFRLASPLLVQPLTLTPAQVESLHRSGIYKVCDATEPSDLAPNSNNATVRVFTTGEKLLSLTTTGSGTTRQTVLDGGYRVHRFQDGDNDNQFIVLGLGSQSTLQGTAAIHVPLVQSADPANSYARVCCVYMIPSDAADMAAVFPARFVGCFLPDGTTARDNMSKYNNNNDD